MINNAEHPEACPKFQDPQAAATDVGNTHGQFAENKTVSRHAKKLFLFHQTIIEKNQACQIISLNFSKPNNLNTRN